MKKTGEFLKSQRIEKGITLEDVAVTTRISVSTLTAIEEGDTDSLPAKSFIRGFVKSYARFLKADEKQVLELFHEEMGTTKPKPLITEDGIEVDQGVNETTPVAAEPRETDDPKPIRAPKLNDSNITWKILIAIGAAVLIGLIFLTKKTIDRYDRESEIPPTQEQVEQINAMESADDAEPEEDEELAVLETTTTLLATTTTVSTTTTTRPSPPTTLVKIQSIDVTIEALDRVEIDYRPDGGALVSKNLDPEEVLNIRAKQKLNIDFSDGGAVNVIYNGKDLGVPGNLGQSYKLRLPR